MNGCRCALRRFDRLRPRHFGCSQHLAEGFTYKVQTVLAEEQLVSYKETGSTEHGFDPEQILALSNVEAVKNALKDKTEQAVKRGVFGAPSFFVGDQLFFGQDRLDFVREALS